MRKVDKLGRIVIPLELRKKYGLIEGTAIEFLDVGEGVTVKPSEPFCKVCRTKIPSDASFPLCESCIAKAIKKHDEKKVKE